MVVDEHQNDMVLWQVALLNVERSLGYSLAGADTARRLLAMCDRRGLMVVDSLHPLISIPLGQR